MIKLIFIKFDIKRLLIYIILLLLSSCAYYNTFFNALKSYRSATEALEGSKTKEITTNINNDFQKSIDKCWKLIDQYGDSSKYADDALLLISKCHYHINEFLKAERYLNQFIQRYTNSELLPEAKLWMAKTLIKLEKYEDAYDQFNDILSNKAKHEIAAFALFSLGELYYTRKEHDLAIDNLRKCVEISKDDLISARAYFLLGNIFFENAEYSNAIPNYTKIKNYDVPQLMDYEARIKKVESEIYLKEYDRALKDLKEMLRDNRYSQQFSLIESKIGDCYRFQDNIDYAVRQYLYVLEKYNKSEGSAAAVYQLAKIMEFYYTDIDSAKNLYARVAKEFNSSVFKEESTNRSKMLETYLKLRANLDRDITDIRRINELDSSATDSVRKIESVYYETVKDTMDNDLDFFEEPDSIKIKKFNLNEYTLRDLYLPDEFVIDDLNLASHFSYNEEFEDAMELSLYEMIVRSEFDSTLINKFIDIVPDTARIDTILNEVKLTLGPTTQNILKKRVQIRTEDDIEKSLMNNQFAMAEFFILNMQNYDSALTAYNNFIMNNTDSILVPKAYHALDYIYSYKIVDSLKADSIEQIILSRYPDSEYSKFIYKKRKDFSKLENNVNTFYKNLYSDAEFHLFNDDYEDAITIFKQIAENDSGSVYAEKSRYAIAWIYEKRLNDNQKAIQAYTIITKEYPEGKINTIAQNKIKVPVIVQEQKIDTTTVHDLQVDTLMNKEVINDSTVIDSMDSIKKLDRDIIVP